LIRCGHNNDLAATFDERIASNVVDWVIEYCRLLHVLLAESIRPFSMKRNIPAVRGAALSSLIAATTLPAALPSANLKILWDVSTIF
jgi:hypothetical protein